MRFTTIVITCFAGLVSTRSFKIRQQSATCYDRYDAIKDARAAGCDKISTYLISGTLCNPYGCDCEWGCIESDGYNDEWISYKCPNGFGVSYYLKSLFLNTLTQFGCRVTCVLIRLFLVYMGIYVSCK